MIRFNVPDAELKPWMKSPSVPDIVYVPLVIGCRNCAFSAGELSQYCGSHACGGGQWRTIEEAVTIKLERA
jgi:hypothetical protein